MGEFSQFVQTEFTEGVAFPSASSTGISAVDTAMADPLYNGDRKAQRLDRSLLRLGGLLERGGPAPALTECQAKHRSFRISTTDWADLQAFYHLDYGCGQPRVRLFE